MPGGTCWILFAGTGNITYEFISRGVKSVTAVDAEQACTRFIAETLKVLKAPHGSVIKTDAFGFIKQCKVQYDFIFADPPYGMPDTATLPELIFTHNILKPGGWFVLEHRKRH